jgi:hypothetical protein
MPNDFPARAHLQRCDERVHARTATQIEGGFAFLEIGKMEIVADTGERLDRLFRDAIQIGRCVAKALGHGSTHLEMELAMRVFRDASVHRLDLGLEFLRIERDGAAMMFLLEKNWCWLVMCALPANLRSSTRESHLAAGALCALSCEAAPRLPKPRDSKARGSRPRFLYCWEFHASVS